MTDKYFTVHPNHCFLLLWLVFVSFRAVGVVFFSLKEIEEKKLSVIGVTLGVT